ncbi:MAG: ABC transporter substrate-binding protein [Verrucomicrobia bacterium]|nr:ABC transporter substrate-binding protein [Verrucomicrobiota bacterium]
MEKRELTLGHSPDPDDAFMFYALARERIDTGEFSFRHILDDIQTLNARGLNGELDITAVSFHAYPFIMRHYMLLPCGSSMGDGYGPLLVSDNACSREEVARKRIAVPGELTSAFLAMLMWLEKKPEQIDYIVVPFDKIFDAVKSGKADVGLIIHEGQLTYARENLQVCEDLGVWWAGVTDSLPLPLGANVIHKRIDAQSRRRISNILKQSIEFGLEHRDEAVEYSLKFAGDMESSDADRFIGMYVNELTLDYGERGREAVREFYKRAVAMRLLPTIPEPEFVDA